MGYQIGLAEMITPVRQERKQKRRALIDQLFAVNPSCSLCGDVMTLQKRHKKQALLRRDRNGQRITVDGVPQLECLECRNRAIQADQLVTVTSSPASDELAQARQRAAEFGMAVESGVRDDS